MKTYYISLVQITEDDSSEQVLHVKSVSFESACFCVLKRYSGLNDNKLLKAKFKNDELSFYNGVNGIKYIISAA